MTTSACRKSSRCDALISATLPGVNFSRAVDFRPFRALQILFAVPGPLSRAFPFRPVGPGNLTGCNVHQASLMLRWTIRAVPDRQVGPCNSPPGGYPFPLGANGAHGDSPAHQASPTGRLMGWVHSKNDSSPEGAASAPTRQPTTVQPPSDRPCHSPLPGSWSTPFPDQES